MAKRAVAPVVDDAPPGVAIIAHNTEVQRWFDELRIPWGAQYEVARGVTDGRWSWSDVTRAKVGQLQGKNAEAAPRVAAAITGVSRTVDANELLLWYSTVTRQFLPDTNNASFLGKKWTESRRRFSRTRSADSDLA